MLGLGSQGKVVNSMGTGTLHKKEKIWAYEDSPANMLDDEENLWGKMWFSSSCLSNYKEESMIRELYLNMLGTFNKVNWRCLVFGNLAGPKSRFTMW